MDTFLCLATATQALNPSAIAVQDAVSHGRSASNDDVDVDQMDVIVRAESFVILPKLSAIHEFGRLAHRRPIRAKIPTDPANIRHAILTRVDRQTRLYASPAIHAAAGGEADMALSARG
jgi:hypothetical protein